MSLWFWRLFRNGTVSCSTKCLIQWLMSFQDGISFPPYFSVEKPNKWEVLPFRKCVSILKYLWLWFFSMGFLLIMLFIAVISEDGINFDIHPSSKNNRKVSNFREKYFLSLKPLSVLIENCRTSFCSAYKVMSSIPA